MRLRDPRLRALLTQADRNATYGKNAAAESLYRQILSDAPDAEEAWLGLAGVVSDPGEKRTAYERVLELAPETPLAIAALAQLDGRPVPPQVAAALAEAEGTAEATNGNGYRAPDAVTEAEPAVKPVEVPFELACYRHPERSTSLRCYNCNRPICISCARKTPVGYICPECQREAEDAFFNSKPTDYLIAALVSLPISLLVGYLLVNFSGMFGFFFYLLIFFISGAVGSFIGRITKRAIGGRRGRYLPGLVVAMMVVGLAIPALPILLAILTGNVGALMALIGPGIYLFVGGGAAYWQMR